MSNEIDDIRKIMGDWRDELDRKQIRWVALAEKALATDDPEDSKKADAAYTDMMHFMVDGPDLPDGWRSVP